MKKWIALALVLLLAVGCFTGCNKPAEEEQTFPEEVAKPTAAPEQQNVALTDTPYEGENFYGLPVVRFEVCEQKEVDLDQCGQSECVALLQVFDEYDQSGFALRVVKGEQVFDTESLYTVDSSLWIEDLNGDGQPEIYTSGDMMSSDYVVYGWELTEHGLQSLSTELSGFLVSGWIDAVEDNVMTIRENQYVLGTWTAVRPFVSSEVRGIEPQNSSVWSRPLAGDGFYLKLIQPLPVIIDGVSLLLPVGTQLLPTAFDGEKTVWFETSAGLSGLVHVDEANQWSEDIYAYWYIEGQSENYYFEMLPYAG